MQVAEAQSGAEREAGAGHDRGDGGVGDEGRRRRLFMAGRVDGRIQQVRFAPSVQAPIRGPWSLALVVRPG